MKFHGLLSAYNSALKSQPKLPDTATIHFPKQPGFRAIDPTTEQARGEVQQVKRKSA